MNKELNVNNEIEKNYFIIQNSIDDIQKMYKEIYRLCRTIKSEEDQKNFYDKMEKLIHSLNNLNHLSHLLDNEFVNSNFIKDFEDRPAEIQEKMNDEFIYVCQMLRGKIENLEKLKSVLK